MQPDGSWKKIPVFIAETEQESIEAGERARNVPGYYAGFSEVHANPDHPLHDRVTKAAEERNRKK